MDLIVSRRVVSCLRLLLSWTIVLGKKKKKGIFYKVHKENVKCGIRTRSTTQSVLGASPRHQPGWSSSRHVLLWGAGTATALETRLLSVPKPPVTALTADRRKSRRKLAGDLPFCLWSCLCPQVSHGRRAGWGWLCPHVLIATSPWQSTRPGCWLDAPVSGISSLK